MSAAGDASGPGGLLADVIAGLQHSLRHMAQAGFSGLDCSPATLRIIDSWQPQIPAPVAVAAPDGKGVASSKTDLTRVVPAEKAAPNRNGPGCLEAVARDIEGCTRCALSEHRTHIVFGAGNPSARLMFIGEGPGADEDRQGQPFVGAAGRLLTKIIESMTLDREQVYICNVVKCRPPGNRTPAPEEIGSCLPFLQRQIDAVAPEFICALGKVAVQTLLGTTGSIFEWRGKFHDYHGIRLMPTFHPAFLLRRPEHKREVWEDVKQLMRAMGTAVG